MQAIYRTMKLSTQILLGFLLIISIDLVDSYTNYQLTREVKTNTAFLTKSESIMRYSSALNVNILSFQNAFRGYLLTNDKSFLDLYYSRLKQVPLLINEEKKMISSVAQARKLDSILFFNKLWSHYADELIDAKRKATIQPKLKRRYDSLFETQFKKQVAKPYKDEIVNNLNSFDQTEYKIRNRRREALANSIKRTETISMLFSVLTIIIGLGSAIFFVTKISRRIAAMVKLAENISSGDFTKVHDTKNDELSNLSISLNTMSEKLSNNIHQLEKQNKELNQFSYVVSHDLKAPIRGIYNLIQWIEEDLQHEISEGMREYLNLISGRIQRMENLIEGLLNYARIGQYHTMSEEVDVDTLVREIAEAIVPAGTNFFTKDLPRFYTEKLLLEQVFSNLIANAVKYTTALNKKIEISCIDKGAFFQFAVSDNGIGIEEQYHEKIFDIFQTLREKDDKESTGIGLAIVKKIIEEKNGTIKVRSFKNKGSSFIFTWPKVLL
jgi:signal transduction histidine kinase